MGREKGRGGGGRRGGGWGISNGSNDKAGGGPSADGGDDRDGPLLHIIWHHVRGRTAGRTDDRGRRTETGGTRREGGREGEAEMKRKTPEM